MNAAATRCPIRRILAIAAVALAHAVGDRSPVVFAQSEENAVSPPAERRVLEEIIVTAQKTEQRLEEVSISMSVVDDAFLNQQSLTDLSELSRYVPNVLVLPAAFSPRANIRGFGVDEVSGGNKSVESPIGMVIDGVSYGNKHYLQTGFFDLDRVEVLRGPQNTLFGKNNSVGLFSIVTKNPTDEFTGFLDAEIGEPERRRFEAAIGGPAVPGIVKFRLAGLSEERDGFKRNTTALVVPEAFDPVVGFDRKALRVKAEIPELLGGRVLLSYEKFAIDVRGIGLEFAVVPESTRSFYREFDPNTDFVYGNNVLSTDLASITRIDIDTFVANGSYKLGAFGLDGVVGHSVLAVDNVVDPDTGPAPALVGAAKDSNPQTTFELRTTSPELPGLFGLARSFGVSTDFTAGLFYQRRQVNESEFTAAFDTAIVGAFAVLTGAQPPGGIPTPPTPITREAVGSTIESTTMFWQETTNTVAGYGQGNWHFAERWTLTGGLRLGNEWKEADWRRVLEANPPVFLTVAGFEEFTARETRSEFQYAPQVSLRWQALDAASVFARWARGFRGGGLNEFVLNGEQRREFDPEETIDWELGSGVDLLGGAARLNLALFHTTIDDFQLVTQLPGGGLIEITKAGKARSQGVETDALWLATDWLTVRGTFAFIDAEFIEFPFGPCTGQNQNTDGDDDARCDLSGRPIPRAPRWVTTLTPAVRFPVGDLPLLGRALAPIGVDLIGALTVEYRDAHYLDLTLDRHTRQTSFFRVDGNLGFENVARGLSLRVTMTNMTDELITDTAREVTLAAGHFVRSAVDPRHVFGELRWSF